MNQEFNYNCVAYEILRNENDEWVWAGYGDSRDTVPLPQEVRDRVAQAQPGKFEVDGVLYWIRQVKQIDQASNQALRKIREKVHTSIEHLFERQIWADLKAFAQDHSRPNAQTLWQNVQCVALDQLGLTGNTEEQIIAKTREILAGILNHYFPDISSQQRQALLQAVEEIAREPIDC
jgi:hypothetical protein